MTAAHCTAGKSPSSFKVTLGDFDKDSAGSAERELEVSQIYDHEDYNPFTTDYDYSLLLLKDPAPMTDCIDVACLPEDPIPVGSTCFITGWGTTSSGGESSQNLQEAAVQIVNTPACDQIYG